MKYYQYDLLKLTMDYITKEKNIDVHYIDRIIEIIVNAKELNAYVRNLQINQAIKANPINYDRYEKIINGNLEEMIRSIPKEFNNLDDYNKILCGYFHIIQLISHEICHARDYKRCIVGPKDIETKILKLSYYNLLIKRYELLNGKRLPSFILKRINETEEKRYQLYKALWNYAPFERIAQIDSFEDVGWMASEIKSELLTNYAFYQKLRNNLDAYASLRQFIKQSYISPTSFYLIQNNVRWQPIQIEKEAMDLDLKKRLRLGLNITKTEYVEKEEELKRIKNVLKRHNLIR